jgi:hypothetical protein
MGSVKIERSTMNRKAIVVYIDLNPKNQEEFTWLWKTWLLWDLNEEYDIVAFCNPEVIAELPEHPNFIKRTLDNLNKPGTFWYGYGFVNSFAMFNDQVEVDFMLENYDYILKSDCDVFLTEHIKGFTPTKTMIGMGGYMDIRMADEVLSKLKFYIDKFNLTDQKMSHIGASIYGNTETVISVVKLHYAFTKAILQSGWAQGDIGKWPGWYKGVASMYAIHLVVNHKLSPQSCSLYTIDSRCWNSPIEKDTIHIHAWHTHEYWSKLKHFEKGYEKLVVTEVPKTVQEYCHWISTNSVEEIISLKNNQ